MANLPSTPVAGGGADGDNDDHSADDSDSDEDVRSIEADNDGDQKEGPEVHNGTTNGIPAEITDYSLFSNPPGLAVMRQRLFEIEDPIELSLTDFEAYFPFVDNVWRKTRGGETTTTQQGHGATTEWFCCRLRRGLNHKSVAPRPTPEGKVSRKKRVKEDKTCDMVLKTIHSHGPVKTVTIARAGGKGDKHTHDLDYLDATKRNSAIMDVARREAMRGFMPTSIFWKMWQEPDEMHAAGGQSMKQSDVRNVQYAWRQQNQAVILRSHTGFYANRPVGKGRRGADLTNPKKLRISRKRRISDAYSATEPTQISSPPPPPANQSVHQAPVLPPSPHPELPPGTLQYPEHARTFLRPYLPDHAAAVSRNRPHVTLTWAQSLDGKIAVSPGVQTAISGPETKAMTHFLRSQHDAILIGVRTAIADDPTLNCRLSGAGGYGGLGQDYHPRPIIIDPHARLFIRPEMKILQVMRERRGKAPWVVVAPHAKLHPTAVEILKHHGGEYLMIHDYQAQTGGFNWEGVFNVLFREGIRSIMVEGGGLVLSELLKPQYSGIIDSVLMTMAPIFIGKSGVPVSPDPTMQKDVGKVLTTRLADVRWQPMGEVDVVMCGRAQKPANGILSGIEEFSHGMAVEAATAANAVGEKTPRK